MQGTSNAKGQHGLTRHELVDPLIGETDMVDLVGELGVEQPGQLVVALRPRLVDGVADRIDPIGLEAAVLYGQAADMAAIDAAVRVVVSRAPGTHVIRSAKDNVVTCRVDDPALNAIDALVEAGIRSTRSDAAAWLIGSGIDANREFFAQVYSTVAEIRRLREKAQALARQGPDTLDV